MWEFHFINFVSPSEPVCLEGHDYELCYRNPPLTITLIRIISYNGKAKGEKGKTVPPQVYNPH